MYHCCIHLCSCHVGVSTNLSGSIQSPLGTKTLTNFPAIGTVREYATFAVSENELVTATTAEERGLRVLEPCTLSVCYYTIDLAGEWEQNGRFSVIASARYLNPEASLEFSTAVVQTGEMNNTFQLSVAYFTTAANNFGPIKLSYTAWNSSEILADCGENCGANGQCVSEEGGDSTCLCVNGYRSGVNASGVSTNNCNECDQGFAGVENLVSPFGASCRPCDG